MTKTAAPGPTLILTPEEHANLRDRLTYLVEYLECERERLRDNEDQRTVRDESGDICTAFDIAEGAVIEATEALDLLDAAATRTNERISEAAGWEWAMQVDSRVTH